MKTQKWKLCFWLVWNNITILYQTISFLSGFSKLEASMHTALGFWSLWFNSPATLPPEPTRWVSKQKWMISQCFWPSFFEVWGPLLGLKSSPSVSWSVSMVFMTSPNKFWKNIFFMVFGAKFNFRHWYFMVPKRKIVSNHDFDQKTWKIHFFKICSGKS